MDIHVAIHEFGPGHSSLSDLKGFPAECLKIDQFFGTDNAAYPNDIAIVSAVVRRGEALHLAGVGKRVEPLSPLHSGQQLGGRGVQGFSLFKSMAAVARGL